MPTQHYGLGGQFTLRLIQDEDNYYEVYNTDGYSARYPAYIRKVVNGIEVDYAEFASEYKQGEEYHIDINFSPTETTIQAFSETLTINTDSDAININSFYIESGQQVAYYDNINYTISTSSPTPTPTSTATPTPTPTVTPTATPTPTPPPSGDFTDDFSTDTTGDYTVTEPYTYGDPSTFTHDSENGRGYVFAGRLSHLRFAKALINSTSGNFSVDFMPTEHYGKGGQFILRLVQDEDNYYEVYNTDGYGATHPAYIKKVVNGTEVDYEEFASEYEQGVTYHIEINFSPTQTTVQAFSQTLTINSSSDAININSFYIESGQQVAYYDNINYSSTNSSTPLKILSPKNNYIQVNDSFSVNLNNISIENGWGIKVVLDLGTDNEQIETVRTTPYSVDFNNLNVGEHTVDAYVINEDDIIQSGYKYHDSISNIGTGGDIIVALGDSITYGYADDISTDNISNDGRNSGLGYTSILNNLLTQRLNKPHSVHNEGVPGNISEEGLSILPNILDKYPNATKYLIMFGTNDAAGWSNVDKNIYKNNMQQIINLIKNRGKIPILAKIPRVLGELTASVSYEEQGVDPENGFRNTNIRKYNIIIDELISENNIEILPPQFYSYFRDTYGDTYRTEIQDGYADNLHPDGLGYRAMANLWADVLTN
jgi:lysophospholipase L1-like esterase